MRRIFWRSWSRFEAEFELNRLKEDNVPLSNQWINAHTQTNPEPNDIWLTTNGYDFMPNRAKPVTWYAESFVYLPNEYNNYKMNQNKWYHRYHFNPNYATQQNSSLLHIACWWQREKRTYDDIIKKKNPTHVFGMVQGKKPDEKLCQADWGNFRTKVVQTCRNRSFYYYGTKWTKDDPNYKGEAYLDGQKHSPQKFNDARRLLDKCKFVWCLENCHDQNYSLNYMTEKIFHGFLSGGVPIYLGAGNIEKMIHPGLFVDIRKFNYDINAVCNYCEKMPDSQYKEMQEMISVFLDTDALPYSCDYRFKELDERLSYL